MDSYDLAFLIPTLRKGGAERVISRLSRYFAPRLRTCVITFNGSEPAYDFGGDVLDLRLPAVPGILGKIQNQRRRAEALGEALTRHRVRQAIAFAEASAPLALVRSTSVHSFHATVSLRSTPEAVPLLQRLDARFRYPKADRIVLQTEAAREQVIREWGLPVGKCAVIRNPVDDAFLRQALAPAEEREPGLILACGRLDPVKGFDLLLRAFARMERREQARLLILGEGPSRKDLEDLAHTLGVASRVLLPGAVSEVLPWFDRAALFALSSRNEGLPNALAEAMARACPSVAFDCPTGPREMLTHETEGLLVSNGDVAGLAASLDRLLGDPALAARLGAAGRNRAEQWSMEALAPRWILPELLGGRP